MRADFATTPIAPADTPAPEPEPNRWELRLGEAGRAAPELTIAAEIAGELVIIPELVATAAAALPSLDLEPAERARVSSDLAGIHERMITELGVEGLVPSLERAAATGPHSRTVDFDAEFQVRSAGGGRTVEAWAVPFDQEAEVIDQEGHYFEVFRHGAFGRSIARGIERLLVLYNHGKDLYMQPSERFSMPLGTPVEVVEEPAGVRTVTRYANTPLADEVLELINSGAIRSQSVTFLRTPAGRGSKRIRRGHTSGLDLVERHDVDFREYGPTPIPVFVGASVIGVRSRMLAEQITSLSPDEREELAELLRNGRSLSPAGSVEPEPEPIASPVEADELLALRHAQLRDKHKE